VYIKCILHTYLLTKYRFRYRYRDISSIPYRHRIGVEKLYRSITSADSMASYTAPLSVQLVTGVHYSKRYLHYDTCTAYDVHVRCIV